MGVIGMTVIYHIQSWKLCYIARHRLLLQSIASGLLKKEFISVLNDRTVIDSTQLGRPPIADIYLSAISCTFECHKSKRVCALRSAY